MDAGNAWKGEMSYGTIGQQSRVNCLVGWSVLELGLTVGRGVQSYSVVDESISSVRPWKEPSIIARS